MGKQSEWPPVRGNPTADYLKNGWFLRSSRSVAGPLRMGTTPGVGPRDTPTDAGTSDMGLDRMPRRFDPMGTHNTREPPPEPSSRLSRDVRNRD